MSAGLPSAPGGGLALGQARRPVPRPPLSREPASWRALTARGRALRSYSVDASEVTDLHVISYELERDLMPLILANCQYQVAQGGESLQELDLERIQRQVTGRFLQGKPRLSLRGLPTLVYRRDWNYEHLFAAIRSRMPQVSPPGRGVRLRGLPSHGPSHRSSLRAGGPGRGPAVTTTCAHAAGQGTVCGLCVLSMYA